MSTSLVQPPAAPYPAPPAETASPVPPLQAAPAVPPEANEQAEAQSSTTERQGTQAPGPDQRAAPAADGDAQMSDAIDPAFLEALPPDIREEVPGV